MNLQVFKVIRKYSPVFNDEMFINADDYVALETDSIAPFTINGWARGTNLTTGNTGWIPFAFLKRAPESDCWTLHTAVQFIGPGSSFGNHLRKNSEISQAPVEESTRLFIESLQKSVFWLSSIGKDVKKPNVSKKLIIMRHAERVDFNFRNWSNLCFTTSNTEPLSRGYKPFFTEERR